MPYGSVDTEYMCRKWLYGVALPLGREWMRMGTGSVMDLSAGEWRLLSGREDENRDKPGLIDQAGRRVRSVSVK